MEDIEMKKKASVLFAALVLTLTFVTGALADTVRVYREFPTSGTYVAATGTTSKKYMVVQIDSKSNFYGSTTNGINFRAYRGSEKHSGAITFRARQVPSYEQREYFSDQIGLSVQAKTNLTSGAISPILFSGVIYF